jgi:hypothetical protein
MNHRATSYEVVTEGPVIVGASFTGCKYNVYYHNSGREEKGGGGKESHS